MEDYAARFWNDIANRPEGPLAFRFYLQPAMAFFMASKAGIADAKTGRPPYLWTVFTNRESRRELLHDGWKDTARVFFFAIFMDVVFQVIVLKAIRPVECVVIAFFLAILPYLLARGPINRIISRFIIRNKIQSRPVGGRHDDAA
jgi:hypothetical protein